MTKKEFLYALEMKLSRYMSLLEVEKVIYYYDEYIEEGKEYLEEDQIIEEIGNIDQLVEDLLHSLEENGLITLKGIEGSIDLKAKNGKIKISDCEGETLVCETENAEISFNNTKFCKGKLFTTNSPIHGKYSMFNQIYEKTKNAYIKNKDVRMIEGILETTNGNIRVTGLEQPYQVLASTKNGMAQVDPRHALVQTILEDQENFLSLKTSNGNIVVE